MLELLKRLFVELVVEPIDNTPPTPPPPPRLMVPGAIHEGRVDYVGPTFAKLAAGGFHAFLPISEMSLERIEVASDAVSKGQVVEFVLLEPSTKVPGEWIASLAAVGEARKRTALADLARGQRIGAEVTALRDNGAMLRAGDAELFVPLAELVWEPVTHPSYALTLGQTVEAEVMQVTLPDWHPRWRQARAKASASLRKCQPRPAPTFVAMAFTAVPFRLVASPRRPKHLDVLVMHVLAELVEGHDVADIEARTQLPGTTLRAMLRLLADEGLANEGGPTQRGRSLIEADLLAQRINDAALGGLACNVAEHAVRIMNRGGRVQDPPYSEDSIIPDYPAAWPRPVFDPRADEQFFRLSDESIPDAVITTLLDTGEQASVAALQGDQRLRMHLRPDGARQAVCTFVSDHWVYGALWHGFEALGTRKPYRPEPGAPRATHLLMVELRAFDAAGALLTPVYLEPYSRTLWRKRSGNMTRQRDQNSSAFPSLPRLPRDGLALADGTIAVRLEAAQWHSVQFREAP
jgi:small subunit ribosomal protein S1